MDDRTVRDADPDRSLPDEVYRRALRVGREAAGRSGPNPPVGCVIVRDGRIVGEGATGPVGGPHAEVVALGVAGPEADGATAVVTLEPCAHHGRTPPCVDALLAAGVRSVHVLHRDPDPAAAGGMARLRAAGVDVVDVASLRPELAAAAAHDLRGFLTRVRAGRPHVVLKLAQSIDGTTSPVGSRYLTGPAARREVHALRADVDAVLVGGGTVRADDPQLDVRDGEACELVRQPRPVVLSASGSVPATARVVRSGAIILVAADVVVPHHLAHASEGVTFVPVPTLRPGSDALDLSAALAALLEHRVLTVLAEPGVRLAAALLDEELVDRVVLHVAGGATVTQDAVRPALPALAPLLDAGSDVERRSTPDGDLVLDADVARLRPPFARTQREVA